MTLTQSLGLLHMDSERKHEVGNEAGYIIVSAVISARPIPQVSDRVHRVSKNCFQTYGVDALNQQSVS